MTYIFLQHYWCFIVALLAAILVFLMFVQGANSLIFTIGKTADERRLIVNATGRKWEFTFTTLVTFGGAFFASYPLFYSTSFGGAYWLWMIILFSFVLQAVSYEFQNKLGNLLGAKTFQWLLVLNGILGPLLLGGAVATFFTGSNFIVEKGNIVNSQCSMFNDQCSMVVSRWANASHGLDALLNLWNLVLGLAVFFLARVLGCLYIHNRVDDKLLHNHDQIIQPLWRSTWLFLGLFLAFLGHILTCEGYAYDPATGVIFMEPYKYLHNLIEMWPLLVVLLIGVVFVLFGILWSLTHKEYKRGFWVTGFGTVVTVLVLLLLTAWNNTAYYPSTADLQSSLTMQNSCSSEFTLRTMFYVSLLVPFVLAYIIYAWHSIDKKEITLEEINNDHAY
ncbi:MAG: cytochrome d ubiquinol oxidase subunit II [Bacteroidaceae bacterium]|nr:cytochrome d ubiquinol oxidase subunit II [Bacteroidaceae bacterium]